jgi:hypothetical protein
MTPYVEALLRELSSDLPLMCESMDRAQLREAAMFRCSEILTLSPHLDVPSASLAMERLRDIYGW